MKPIRNVYIHIPFCKRKCGYCSFYSVPIEKRSFLKLKQDYLSTLQHEIELFQDRYDIQPDTIYFGGGTPSLLTPDDFSAILSRFDYNDDAEITIEMNPAVVASPFQDYRALFNRVSLGVQSFIDRELKLLGRLHDTCQAEKTIDNLRNAGFDNLSIDLMYGLPGQTMDDIRHNLKRVVEIQPEHVSIYNLSLEPDAPMFGTKLPEDDLVADFYFALQEKLTIESYRQYEISNFAKKGFHSRHNTSYWKGVDYLGLGAGASGFVEHRRYTNPKDIQAYSEDIRKEYIMPNAIELFPEELRQEMILLSLRTTQGLDLEEYTARFQRNLLKDKEPQMVRLLHDGYIQIIGGFLHLLPKGYFVSNEIIGMLL